MSNTAGLYFSFSWLSFPQHFFNYSAYKIKPYMLLSLDCSFLNNTFKLDLFWAILQALYLFSYLDQSRILVFSPSIPYFSSH